ncbi:DUF4360 domain-containing protein, partial [Nostoc sp.]|uniref:DUF4360 domain-containing protein n=1 Tax=Nostoc sp. TaxID=1180 RepID=UPI002FF568F0
MKLIKFVKAFFAAATLTTASIGPAFAADTVQILGATYNGSGCPINTVTVTPSLDYQTLSVLFNQYIATANNVSQSYRTCNLVIPIKSTPRYSVESMGSIVSRTSQLDPCVPVSVYTAPDVFSL